MTALFLVTKPQVEEEKNEFPPLAVNVVKARADEQIRTSAFQGEVRAKTDIEVVTQVTGKVIAVSDKFVEGGQFAVGEIMLRIDDADYRVALKSAEAAVAEAKVQLDIELASAETSKKEWRDLTGESLATANPLRLNQPQVQGARARLDAAKAQQAQAQLDYNRTKIRAPFSGRVMRKSAELGQFVSRGASIGRMFSTDSVEIRVPMSDLQIGELGLELGMMPSQREPIQAKVATLFGNQRHEWTGYLKSIDASIDNETRLLFGTIAVDNPFELTKVGSVPLAPGLFVDVEIKGSRVVSGVSVPRTALRSGNQVYVVKNGEIRLREVGVLYTSPNEAVLQARRGSIVAGDQVIVSPVPGAYDGMVVEVKGNIEATSAASATEEGVQKAKLEVDDARETHAENNQNATSAE